MGKLDNISLEQCGHSLYGILVLSRYVAHQWHDSQRTNIGGWELNSLTFWFDSLLLLKALASLSTKVKIKWYKYSTIVINTGLWVTYGRLIGGMLNENRYILLDITWTIMVHSINKFLCRLNQYSFMDVSRFNRGCEVLYTDESPSPLTIINTRKVPLIYSIGLILLDDSDNVLADKSSV